jgi:predicted Zn-dependent protease
MRAILFILAAAVAASAQNSKEAALGAQLAKEIRLRTTAIEDPALQEYIERIGRKQGSASGAYTFALIADDAGGKTHEPLSLPGGYIFVSAELLRSAADEAEVAGMLAHAMAHAASRPLARVAAGGTIPIVFIGGWQGLGAGRDDDLLPASVLITQRENETRADALAVQAMSAAGYDPDALARYVSRTQPPDGAASQRFPALPERESRLAALGRATAELPARAYAPTDPDEFGRMQEQVRSHARGSGLPAENRPRPTLQRQT